MTSSTNHSAILCAETAVDADARPWSSGVLVERLDRVFDPFLKEFLAKAAEMVQSIQLVDVSGATPATVKGSDIRYGSTFLKATRSKTLEGETDKQEMMEVFKTIASAFMGDPPRRLGGVMS